VSRPLWEITNSCRVCGHPSLDPVFSFGATPLADKLQRDPNSRAPAPEAPLEGVHCSVCGLTQLSVSVDPEFLFGTDYPYYSSVSPALAQHFELSAREIIDAEGIGPGSTVIEAASNDGVMLRHFLGAGAIVMGFDPAAGPARKAIESGVDTRIEFFGAGAAEQLVEQGVRADVFLANNVLAHVPEPRGFVSGIARLLQPKGVAVLEVPYLVDLVEGAEFDTIYHQHLCYFALAPLQKLFSEAGLAIADAQRIAIHGGSLRLQVRHGESTGPRAQALIDAETRAGWTRREFAARIGESARLRSTALAERVASIRAQGSSVAAYGAAGKATTLLRWSGLDAELDFVADLNPHKHGWFMPGTDLEIVSPGALLKRQPDYVVILAWNFADEIIEQLDAYRRAGGRFIVAGPDLQVIG
jgi:SAM-dependent methyltransferase